MAHAGGSYAGRSGANTGALNHQIGATRHHNLRVRLCLVVTAHDAEIADGAQLQVGI